MSVTACRINDATTGDNTRFSTFCTYNISYLYPVQQLIQANSKQFKTVVGSLAGGLLSTSIRKHHKYLVQIF